MKAHGHILELLVTRTMMQTIRNKWISMKIENNKMGCSLDSADEAEEQIFESVELKQRAMSQVKQSSKESIVENLKNLEIKDRLDMINFKNQFLKKVIDSNILPFHEKQVFIDELEHTEDSAIQQSKKNAI